MIDQDRKKTFLELQGQTTPFPYLIDVANAEGIYITDKSGKIYLDMIAGVAVTNIGHRHPQVIEAIKNQLDKHLHVMVYGEYIQDSQIALAKNLQTILPKKLNCSYIVNSGTEANEAAIKLAKRYTGRYKIIAFKGAYHGNTHGSMSISHNEIKKAPFRPLLPEISFLELNNFDDLNNINEEVAGVILETIQADAGLRKPTTEYLQAVKKKCEQNGSLLIFDEIQVGMGRTGKMFAFEHYNVVPDILTLGKALGGGMPIGAFISSREIMSCLKDNPMLGHITTFGGHPVNCAAADACITVLKTENWIHDSEMKGALLEEMIKNEPEVKEIRRAGLFFAVELDSADRVKKIVESCLQKGLIGFWFLSCPDSFRLSPPLSITVSEIEKAGQIILEAFAENR